MSCPYTAIMHQSSNTSMLYVAGCSSSFFLGALNVANSVQGRWVCMMARAVRAKSTVSIGNAGSSSLMSE